MNPPVSHMDKHDMSDFSKSFMFLIHQMLFLVQKRLEHVLSKKKSLTFSQFLILVGFHCEDGHPVSQLEIAERLNLTEATVSRHISTLVTSGHLLRTQDKANRRKRVIEMTNKGNTSFKKTADIVHIELASIFSSIDEKDRKIIMKNFSQVLSQLLGKK